MFFFGKKKNKEYVSCDMIEHGMDFFTDSINFCCRIPPTDKGYKKILENYHGEVIDFKKFFAVKKKYRNQMKKGEIIPECKNCVYLQKKEWDDKDYISFINFNNWTICNEHCVYCHLNDENIPRQTQYNVYPVIKTMAEKGYLKKGGHITIAGGEPCVAPEFNDLLELFTKYDLSPVRILTNASIYSEALEKGIKSGNFNTVISVDSGKKETFIKIKKHDFYDKVWENIKRYASVQPSFDRVKTKYILIPGINDNEEEIYAWVNKSYDSGVSYLAFDIEMMWYDKNKDNIPEEIYSLTQYLNNITSEKGLKIEYIDRGYIINESLKQKNNNP